MVRIVAVKPSFERTPFFVSPFFDKTLKQFSVGPKVYVGKKIDDPRNGDLYEIVDAPVKVTNDSEFMYKHGDIFDPSSAQDMFQLQVLKDSGALAESRRLANPSPFPSGHRFYKDDPEENASESSTKADKVLDALQLVSGWTGTDMRDVAFIENKNVLRMSERQIEGFVKELAMTRPERILMLGEDRSFKEKAFLRMLVHHNILQEKIGQYRHADEIIGIDEPAALDFIRNPRNSSVVSQLATELERRKEKTSIGKGREKTDDDK